MPFNAAAIAAMKTKFAEDRYAGKSAAEICRLVNEVQSTPVLRPMKVSAFLDFLAGNALLKPIRDGQTSENAVVASVCLRLMFAANADPDKLVDPTDGSFGSTLGAALGFPDEAETPTGTRGMVAVLVGAGIVSAEIVGAWLAACQVQEPGRADSDVMGFGQLTIQDVEAVLAAE